MSPMRPAIDQIFRTVLDESCEKFQAKAAQTIKNALNDLDNMLKGKCCMILLDRCTHHSPRGSTGISRRCIQIVS